MDPKDAPIVIATVGGAGTRMYPLTLNVPKPLVPICNYPILRRTFEVLANQGCREFIFASKGADNTMKLNAYFKWGIPFTHDLNLSPRAIFNYQPNYKDKGSADAVRACMEYFNVTKDVLVIGGDHILDIDLDKFMAFHKEKHALITIGLLKVNDVSQYGIADIEKDGLIHKFVEKPRPEEAPSNLASIGVYIISPRIRDVFRQMDPGAVADFGFNTIPYLVEKGYGVYGYMIEGYWNDVGTIEGYFQTTMDILQKRIKHIKLGNETAGLREKFIHKTTLNRIQSKLDNNKISIKGNVIIGGDCEIGEGVEIEDSCIGDNCIIENGVKIKRSVVMSFTNIERNSLLNKCIVSNYSIIGKDSIIDADIEIDSKLKGCKIPVIGEDVTLFDRSIIGPGKRVAPISKSHIILSTEKFIELGMDEKNIYFIEK